MDDPTQEQIRAALKPVELKCPKRWKKGEAPGVYNRKRLRIVMTGTDELTVSISSSNQNGLPCHPTDDQCQQALRAFGFEEAAEFQMTTSARYFKVPVKHGTTGR